MNKKKIKIPCEVIYVIAIFSLSFAVAMISSTNFGLSMIVSPAYILSCKIGLTFGQCEYILQGVLFVLFCVIIRKFKPAYLCSFLTGVIYGAVLDMWRKIIPHFNPDVTSPGSLPLPLKIVYFVLGMLLTSFSVALFFRTYIYPQVYDFFVKGVSERYSLDRGKFKTCFDISMLVISCAMSLILFRKFVGVGVGTLIMACFNGTLISLFGKFFDRFFAFEPLFKKLSRYFELT